MPLPRGAEAARVPLPRGAAPIGEATLMSLPTGRDAPHAGAAALVAAVWRAAILAANLYAFCYNFLQFTGFHKSDRNGTILGSGHIGKE